MKKKTKQRLAVLIILVLFGISPIAYVATGFGGGEQQIKPLESFVVEGKVNDLTKNAYIQGGYTFLTYSNLAIDPLAEAWLDSMPEQTQTLDGQTQLIVEKDGNATGITITNARSYERIENFTRDGVFQTLCDTLTVTPLECGLRSLNESGEGA